MRPRCGQCGDGASSFNGATGTITFGFGQTTAQLTIDPQSDSEVESTEDILLTIISSLTYDGGGNFASGLILDI